MYIKEKLLKILNIKNWLIILASAFMLFSSGAYIISELVYYSDDLETAMSAVSMDECIFQVILSFILLIIVYISKEKIYFANFCSSYFEGDLHGKIKYEDLSKVTGMPTKRIKFNLKFLRLYLMKNFNLGEVNGKEMIILESKTCLCSCNYCGAPIEASVYFNGECSYCGGSDLHARIITGNRFYDISNEVSQGVNNPKYYLDKRSTLKRTFLAIGMAILLFVTLIIFIMSISDVSHYFDKEYQKKILLSPDNHLSSYALIKADILDTIIYDAVFLIVAVPLLAFIIKKLRSLNNATNYSQYLSTCKKPFIDIAKIPSCSSEKSGVKKINRSLRYRYLRNCCLEMHDEHLKVALAKKIVKDQCPSCGASIVGAADENYVCKYCGNKIMDVVVKK